MRLIIGPRKTNLITADGAAMVVYELAVAVAGQTISFHDCLDLRREGCSRAVFRDSRGEYQLYLPPSIQRGIDRVLAHYHGRQDMSFDCLGFVNSVSGLRHYRRRMLWRHWQPISWRNGSHVGDTVFLLREKGELFCHAAIHMGAGLWLSIYGAGGDLEVATLEDMIRGYQATSYVRVVPR